MSRLAPKPEVIKALFALSGNKCSYPDCTHYLITEKGNPIADICHIEAANKGGARYNPTESDEQRRSYDNLILLCPTHHREVDSNPEFTVERLQEIKKLHEKKFRNNRQELPDDVFEKLYNSLQHQILHLIDVSEDTNIMVHSLSNQLKGVLRNLTAGTDEEKFLDAQLEFAKNLKRQGKHQTAIDLLLDYKNNNWETLTPQMQFQLIANIGMSYFDIHDITNAAKYLVSIAGIRYESPDSLTALCLGYATAGKHQEFDISFKKAIAIAPENINLWIAYIQRYKKEKTAQEIAQHLPSAIRDSVPIAITIGNLVIEEGNHKEGIIMMKKALENQQEDVDKASDTKLIVATRIIQLLVDPFKYTFRNYTKDELTQLEEAIQLLTEAWDFFNNTELAKFKWHTVLNRGVIHKLTGRLTQALSDFQRAYDLSNEFLAFKNLLFIHIQMGNIHLADQLLHQPNLARELTQQEEFEIQTFHARILCQKGQVLEAIQIMSSLITEENEKKVPEIITQIIAICFENGLLDLAAPWCERMVIEFPALSTGYTFSGYLFRMKGDRNGALDSYNKGLSLLKPSTSRSEIFELAEGYMHLKQFEQAIPLFETLANKNLLNPFTKGLILAFYQLGDLEASLSIAENLFDQYPQDPFLAEIISNIYDETKQYNKAIVVLERFLLFSNDNLKDEFTYRVARLYSFLENWEQTKKYALQVKQPENLSMVNSFAIAYLLIKAGELNEGMKIAYETRTRYFDESEAHQKYLSICINAERNENELFPSIVRAETAVAILTAKGDEKTFLVTKNNSKGENILHVDDPFAQVLIGKNIGDSIIIDQCYGLSHSVTVKHIMDIYTHAFRESMSLFETRFAGQQGITIFHVESEEPSAEFEQFIRTSTVVKNSFEKEAYTLYNERKATIGFLARVFKRNVVMQWFAMVSSTEIFLSALAQNEWPEADKTLTDKVPLVLDLTALLTMFFVSTGSNYFSHLSNRLFVTKSTLDELLQCYNDLEGAAKEGYLSVDYQEGKLVRHEIAKDAIQNHRETLQQIISWCHNNCTVAYPSKLLAIKRADRDRLSKILGDCFYDASLLAEELNAAIVSDDDIFKQLFRSEKIPQPFATLQVVAWLHKTEKISIEAVDQFRLKLIYFNYMHIPVSASQLWECFEKCDYRLVKPFTVAVKGLLIMLLESSVYHLTTFLRKLYVNIELNTIKENTVLLIFNEISKRSDFNDYKLLLFLFIGKEFHFLPEYKDELLEILDNF